MNGKWHNSISHLLMPPNAQKHPKFPLSQVRIYKHTPNPGNAANAKTNNHRHQWPVSPTIPRQSLTLYISPYTTARQRVHNIPALQQVKLIGDAGMAAARLRIIMQAYSKNKSILMYSLHKRNVKQF